MRLIVKIAVTGAAFWLASWLLKGIQIGTSADSFWDKVFTLGVIAVIFGVVNAVLKPIIQTLGCGFYILTLGLFGLIVNAALFMLVAWLAEQFDLVFSVDNFGWALLGSIVVTVAGWVINLVLPDRVATD
ncbi:phage holin family protein [Glycomyces sp. L485]|uniref:phage holin family protein n=1 Tax=Glycomyces sp. L485 TaxID=2909235 RepID=UPI001F4B7A8B|nr:phage holin family protein [Glycomyces sp. L485]MCH7232892.1 phage holin family protein [Glycomyces sp. L485]